MEESSAPNLADLPVEGGDNPDFDDSNPPEDLPPLRMHLQHRLSASGSNLLGNAEVAAAVAAAVPGGATPTGKHPVTRRRSSKERRGSRSNSPGFRSGTAATSATTYDGNSSISSIDDLAVDTDILTDKLGLEELDLERSQSESQLLVEKTSALPSVNERLSEETMEDSHAFTDVIKSGGSGTHSATHSRGTSSIATGGEAGSLLLETLEEGEEDEGVDEEVSEKVILTNMENLTIQEHHEEADDDDAVGGSRNNSVLTT